MTDWMSDPQIFISLLTLTLLEIVLGIDNIIFISIIAGKVSIEKDRRRARTIGLLLALFMRIGLLFGISLNNRATPSLIPLSGLVDVFKNMGMEHALET